MKYYIKTFGCQMNKSDSERVAAVLESCGYQKASKMEEANLVVVNMCSVRQSAVDRVYGLLPKFRQLKTCNLKLHPVKLLSRRESTSFAGFNRVKTILTGCVLKKDRKKFAKQFDLILDIKDLPKWPKLLKLSENSSRTLNSENGFRSDYLKVLPKVQTSFQAFVPIMTGCNNFCTFCVVPYTRGREISRSAEEILCEAETAVKRGAKEIWLLGQNVNSYKCKNQKSKIKMTNQNAKRINFPILLRRVNAIPGNFWIRFTSSHPKDFSDELVGVMAESEKVTPYLNLPVQSGDNTILRKMNRPYTIEQYKKIIKKVRGRTPDITLSTDIIVGFPGETKKQFENTKRLFKEIKFDMAYIAQFSPRPDTTAAKMEDNVPQKEKERREKVLTEILKESALKKNKNYIGRTVKALVMKHETRNMKHFYIGKTRHYKTVKFQVPGYKFQDLIGQFIKVKITDALPWGLKGTLLK